MNRRMIWNDNSNAATNKFYMEFIPLEREEQLEEIAQSKENKIIFKHNTTCPISKSVYKQLGQEGDQFLEGTPVYYLDLKAHQDLSDQVAEKFNVPHESPQLLVIKDGKSFYNQSLYNISAEETAEAIKEYKSK